MLVFKNEMIILVIFVIISLLTTITHIPSVNGNPLMRNDVAPKGCKWQRIVPSTTEQFDDDLGGGGGGGTSASRTEIRHQFTCKLKTISDIISIIGNLSVYQTDRISSLSVDCNREQFIESSLEPNKYTGSFLGTLRNLRQLHIDYCNIRNIPSMVLKGMTDLRILKIKSYNSDWDSSITMRLNTDSFRGLVKMIHLDLSENNIQTIPLEVFCPLLSLRTLNLTRNHLNEIRSLGFTNQGKSCNSALEILDLTQNYIKTIPSNNLSSLISLQTLLLQDNRIKTIEENAFSGLESLNLLNISGNNLIDLPAEVFHSGRTLTQLFLQNNSLTILAPGLFDRLDHLELLDLSQNKLTSHWINRKTFTGLIRLVVLNIGHNQLTKIEQNVFHGLYSLQILNLENNRIELIASHAFADLRNLHALTLSNNRLTQLDPNQLSDLYVLNQLFLESNEIATADPNAFENLTNLNDLSLNDNRLIEIPNGIRKLIGLKSLDLGKNLIRTIQPESFDGLDQLLGLRLVENQLENITKTTFSRLTGIHVLNLASNKIRYVDPRAFEANPTLRAIRLDDNQLEDISGVFQSLPSLVWLNISDNRINSFDYSHLPTSVEWLDMHRNNISEMTNYFDALSGLQIKMLDVSFNMLSRLGAGTVPDTIETLFVNNNHLTEVESGTFLNKRNIEKVVLYGNHIRSLDIGAFALPPISDTRDMPAFYIAENLMHCDCRMEWLQRVNELSQLRQHPRVLDLDMVMCTMEHERGEFIRPLMDLRSDEFLCKYDSHCFTLCHCCDFDACDCKMTCPDRCSCYHDHTWSTNVVDCGQAEYTAVPDRIPMDATAIYLDGNTLGDLAGHQFIGKKKLELLYLNASRVISLNAKTFNGVPSLKVLHIENNELTKITDEFTQLPKLNELYLENNQIKSIGADAFRTLRTLEIINLSGNNLENFEPWRQLSGSIETGALVQVLIKNAKWNCNCSKLALLTEWIRDLNIEREFDLNQMVCVNNNNVGEVIRKCDTLPPTEKSPPNVQETILFGNSGSSSSSSSSSSASEFHTTLKTINSSSSETSINDNSYMPLVAAILVATISVVLLLSIVCIFQQNIRLWAHSRYGLRLCRDPISTTTSRDDHEKLFDAYFVYSIGDTHFTQQLVSSELQGYNICLHHRDISSTASYLNDSLQSAADASRKLVLIVSMNFLQHEWSQPQFRLGLQKVIENIRPSERSRKLILILTAPIEIVTIDPIMQILIDTCPVICSGDKKFWQKLRYSLPDLQTTTTGGRHLKKDDIQMSIRPNLRYTPAPSNGIDQIGGGVGSGGVGGSVGGISSGVGGSGSTGGGVVNGMNFTTHPEYQLRTISQRSSHTEDEVSSSASSLCGSVQNYDDDVGLSGSGITGGGNIIGGVGDGSGGGSGSGGITNAAISTIPQYTSASSLGHVYSTIPEMPHLINELQQQQQQQQQQRQQQPQPQRQKPQQQQQQHPKQQNGQGFFV